MEEVDT
jgi:hypothetical protein